MDNKFIRFNNVALVMGIDRSYVNKISQHILIFLASHSKEDGSFISVSHKTLGDETGYSTKSIGRVIDFLVKNKLLIVTNEWRKGCHKPTIYKLNIKLIKSIQSHSNDDLSTDNLSIDKSSVPSLSTYLPPKFGSSLDNLSRDLPPRCLIKKVLNNKDDDVMYECENLEPSETEQTNQEQEMINSDNPLYEELIERGLNKKQANEILAIEKTKVGYIQSNSSYFDNQFKNSPEKNNVGMLLTCLRNNWSKFGETAVVPKTAPKPIPTSYVPPSPVFVIDTPLTRKEASNQRFERARAATPEQRIAWMNFVEKIDCYCVPQFANLGLSKNDFVDFSLPGESPIDGKPTLFKSCVTRIMEVIEQSEKRGRDSRQSKFQKQVF